MFLCAKRYIIMSDLLPLSSKENDPFENALPLTQSNSDSCPSYLDAVVDISDDDFEIPCSQQRLDDRLVFSN